MSTATSLTSATKGRLARFIRLCLNNPSIRAHLQSNCATGLAGAGVCLPGFDQIHTHSYLLTIANAIVSKARYSSSIGVFFELGAIFSTCGIQVCWEEDGAFTVSEAVRHIRMFVVFNKGNFYELEKNYLAGDDV